MFIKIIDVETAEIIKSEIFYSHVPYIDKWTTGLEGINPLDATISILKNKTTKSLMIEVKFFEQK